MVSFWPRDIAGKDRRAMKAGDILRRAAELVEGDRAATYGDMEQLHEKIAILWNAWMKVKRDPDAPFNAEDVAHMMGDVKKARTQCGEGTPDSYIDGAAYQGIAGQLHK